MTKKLIAIARSAILSSRKPWGEIAVAAETTPEAIDQIMVGDGEIEVAVQVLTTLGYAVRIG